MSLRLLTVFTLFILAAQLVASLHAAATTEEQALIEVLLSNRHPREKDAACIRLQRIGTADSVPALATLLTDDQLSHAARNALEPMPFPEAAEALKAALATTSGLTRAGIVNSIGQRRDRTAVNDLSLLLGEPDTTVAAAAASALGRIGGRESTKVLGAALRAADEPLRSALLDGLLISAHSLLEENDSSAARIVFLDLSQSELPPHVRTAAFRGLLRASNPEQTLALITTALEGEDAAAQTAALSLIPELPGPDVTIALANLLPRADPMTQLALLDILGQRGDSVAASSVLAMTRATDRYVRVAAISHLGSLGDAAAVPVLIDAATSSDPASQRAARQSLLVLRHGDVTDALLGLLTSSTEPALTELIRALGGRADRTAVPRLLELSTRDNPTTRTACFQALATLADARDLEPLTQLLLAEQDSSTREEARRTLATVCRRSQNQHVDLDVRPIVDGLAKSTEKPEARAALLQVSSMLVNPQIRVAILKAVRDPNPAVRDAAIRAACDSQDPSFLPDLLEFARDPAFTRHRTAAIRGYVRLATDASSTAPGRPSTTDRLKQILDVAERPEDQRIVLAGLATQTNPEGLALAIPMLDNPAVQMEAAQTILSIAGDISAAHVDLAEAALHKALSTTTNVSQRQAIASRLNQIEARADYLTAWNVAGPYRENGLDYAALFDTPFPPETANASADFWQPLPISTAGQVAGVMDLLKPLGGEQCVAYVRTAIHVNAEQPAILELGTDDGVKAWLNGTPIHANNVARPLAVGSDKVPVNLESGWNTLLLKITQNNLGWEYTARFTRPDGSRISGIKVDPDKALP
jgi:HEAT repeat protein